MSLEALLKIDPGLLRIKAGHGIVSVSNALQGRIFASFGEELVHRFDAKLAADAPVSSTFNNIGGNSLWPGPEGGPFAFNYPCGREWQVQPAIGMQTTNSIDVSLDKISVGKEICLVNRGGFEVKLSFNRTVFTANAGSFAAGLGLEWTAYRSLDELVALGDCPSNKALFCAWSLEQFPGCDGVFTFGKTGGAAKDEVNTGYYSAPGDRLSCDGQFFTFDLGGAERQQIGLDCHSQPEFIAAFDKIRSLLIVRRVWSQEGTFINIADNAQPSGPFDGADSFSVFNGAQLGFFELETVAPLLIGPEGNCVASRLWSETVILRGPAEKLRAFASHQLKTPLWLNERIA